MLLVCCCARLLVNLQIDLVVTISSMSCQHSILYRWLSFNGGSHVTNDWFIDETNYFNYQSIKGVYDWMKKNPMTIKKCIHLIITRLDIMLWIICTQHGKQHIKVTRQQFYKTQLIQVIGLCSCQVLPRIFLVEQCKCRQHKIKIIIKWS